MRIQTAFPPVFREDSPVLQYIRRGDELALALPLIDSLYLPHDLQAALRWDLFSPPSSLIAFQHSQRHHDIARSFHARRKTARA
jgi:hypothetical protein